MMRLLFCLTLFASCVQLEAKSTKSIPFDDSMKLSRCFKSSYSYRNSKWQRLRKMYENYMHAEAAHAPIIPHYIHFIWLGCALPGRCHQMIATWRDRNPGWTIKVWSESDIEPFQMKNRAAFEAAKSVAEKSNIWRYEILDRYGGLFVDTDFECLKGFQEIHDKCAFYTSLSYDRRAHLLGGLIGSVPNHPILKACIDALQSAPECIAGAETDLLSSQFFQYTRHHTDLIVAFPVSYFYPFPAPQRGKYTTMKKIKQTWIRPESFTLYYWSRS